MSVGMYSGKEAPEHRYTDLCFDSNKARQYLPFLTREKTMKAVVESVYAAHRFKVYVPKENCMINFVLSGVKCPSSTRFAPSSDGGVKPIKEAEPFGEEAKAFARRHANQHNVVIEIEDMDRGGNAFGPMYVFISISKERKN